MLFYTTPYRMIAPLTGSEIRGVLEKKAKCLISFEVLSDVRDISVLVKEACVDLVQLLNTAFLDVRLSRAQRFEYTCQSILAALDDAEKVGTKLMEESIAIEKTKDALKRIEEARNFVKNLLPEMTDLILVVNDALADGRIEMREVVDVAQAVQKVNWRNAFAACFGLCCQKKTVPLVGHQEVPVPVVVPAVPAPVPAVPAPVVVPVVPAPVVDPAAPSAPAAPAAPAAAPESPIPEPPLTPPQGEPEPLEAPAPPQSSDVPAAL